MDAEARRVEEIRQRFADFVARYSPGPDWEPCNQMSQDRGWLLTHLDALITRLHEAERTREDVANKVADWYEGRLAQAGQRVAALGLSLSAIMTHDPHSWQGQHARAALSSAPKEETDGH